MRVHDAVLHCRAAEIRSEDVVGHIWPDAMEAANGERHATAPAATNGLNVPLLVNDSIDEI